jgi:hypothetical protein
MGKMKELSMELEQQEQEDDFDVVMEEMHYIHVIDSFVSLIQVYGWSKVTEDLRSKMGELKW